MLNLRIFTAISRIFDTNSKSDEHQAISSSSDAKQKYNSNVTFQTCHQLPKAPPNTNCEKFEKLPTPSLFDLSSINTSLDISCSNSIASLNEIAEILKRQSLIAEPRLAVEELLSLGNTINPYVDKLGILL